MSRNFMELLKAQWAKGNFVCVGLDSEYAKIPNSLRAGASELLYNDFVVSAFNQQIVEATSDLVCAYKPNLAFYLSHGEMGIIALKDTILIIHLVAPNVPVILDAKFGDIGNTNEGYAQFAFDYLRADAVTVHGYLGKESLRPFLDRKNKGVVVLCRTSNPGAGEFQELSVLGAKLYRLVARHVADEWNNNGNCAVVAGATYPEELGEIRQIVDDMPILIPGIGAQGGEIEKTVIAGQDKNGQGMIINSSRGIIFASNPREETLKLHNLINQFRKEGGL